MESFFAASMKPQVFTTIAVASSGSSTRVNPPAARRPASSSESTSLRAQPRLIRCTGVGLTRATLPHVTEGAVPDALFGSSGNGARQP